MHTSNDGKIFRSSINLDLFIKSSSLQTNSVSYLNKNLDQKSVYTVTYQRFAAVGGSPVAIWKGIYAKQL